MLVKDLIDMYKDTYDNFGITENDVQHGAKIICHVLYTHLEREVEEGIKTEHEILDELLTLITDYRNRPHKNRNVEANEGIGMALDALFTRLTNYLYPERMIRISTPEELHKLLSDDRT